MATSEQAKLELQKPWMNWAEQVFSELLILMNSFFSFIWERLLFHKFHIYLHLVPPQLYCWHTPTISKPHIISRPTAHLLMLKLPLSTKSNSGTFPHSAVKPEPCSLFLLSTLTFSLLFAKSMSYCKVRGTHLAQYQIYLQRRENTRIALVLSWCIVLKWCLSIYAVCKASHVSDVKLYSKSFFLKWTCT